MTGLAILCWAVWLGVFSLNLFGTFLCLSHLRSRKRLQKRQLPPVSILKPLKGIDAGLYENLKSFFLLDYPDFEISFCIANGSDPARPIVEQLLKEFPYVNAQLSIGEVIIGINPKVNNLVQSYNLAKNDWIWISDSNVRVEPDDLRSMMNQTDEQTGVLTCLVAGVDPLTASAHMEAAYLNSFYAKWMMIASVFKKPCVVGKAMVFKKSMALRFGGIANLSRYLAEDFMAGEATRKLGLKVLTGYKPVQQVLNGKYSFEDFWNRHIRWGRIRKAQSFLAFINEIYAQSIPCGLLLGYATGFSGAWLSFHFSLWFLADFFLYIRMTGTYSPQALVAWIMRELLAAPLWLHTLFGNTVLWRGKRLRLLDGGLLESTTS